MHFRKSAPTYTFIPLRYGQRVLSLSLSDQLFHFLYCAWIPHVALPQMALIVFLFPLTMLIVRPAYGFSSADTERLKYFVDSSADAFTRFSQSETYSANLRGIKFLEQMKPERSELKANRNISFPVLYITVLKF